MQAEWDQIGSRGRQEAKSVCEKRVCVLQWTPSLGTVCLGGIVSQLVLGKHENENKRLLESVSTSILVVTQVVCGKFEAVFSSSVCSSSVRRLLS